MSSSSTAAAEAVARARAIAARLSGTVPTGNPSVTTVAEGQDSEHTGGKRKRWGVMPETAAAGNGNGNGVGNGTTGAGAELPGLSEAAKRQKLATEPTEKRLWVMSTSSEKPISHFVAFLTPKLLEIEQAINQEMAEHKPETTAKDAKFAIQLRGRGSSRPPPLPGTPELPLHIMLLGLPDAITRAEPIVEPLLFDAENAPLEQPLPETEEQLQLQQQQQQQQQQQISYEGALTVSRNGSSYRPTSMAQLLGQGDTLATIQGGQGLEEDVRVPNGVVGFIIGRGGENIASMQARTGCKVQIQKEHELQPGQTQRVITLQAMRQEQIDECRALIENMVQERVQASGRGGPGGGGSSGGPKDGRVQDALAGGHELVQVEIPDADVGLIIGKMGSTIKSIQEQSGASIQVPQSGNADNPQMRTVSITHPTEQGAMYAKQMIEDLLKSKPSYAGGGGGGGGGQGGGQQFSIQVPIPDKDVGLCIGRQGCVIRHLQSTTNTRIQIPSQAAPGEMYRISTVSGSQQGCEQAKQMIERIVVEQSSAGVMGGGQGGQQQHYSSTPHGGQQHQGQQQGQSAEWAAYYAAQAAAQQQQQYAASATQTAPAPAPAGPAQAATGADAYYEQFFRYAYYYGEEAARAYYGAWSPPAGTPNPYGVNPAGIQPAPAPAPAPAPTSTPAPAAQPPMASSADRGPSAPESSQTSTRETSRRKVSNLPSWMTKGQS